MVIFPLEMAIYSGLATGNGPFIDDFPIKTPIYQGFSMAMLNNQMVDEMVILMVNMMIFVYIYIGMISGHSINNFLWSMMLMVN